MRTRRHHPHRVRRGIPVFALCVAVVGFTAACLPSAPSGAPAASAPSSTRTATATADRAPSSVPTSDGEADASQSTVRTGPIALYGGPAYGDQGIEETGPGIWCDTLAVFWGGDAPIPADVTFTVDAATADAPGLAVDGGVCGTRGADRSCLGLVVAADDTGLFCSLVLRPGADFVEGTAVALSGTLRCLRAEACDAVAARTHDPSAPILVTTPEPAS
ncbi:hypothetical protein CVS47_01510 [Microbacterium lemovicicum]|uniref:Uncharacterized protein n=1 Tax=Microbacterium lemovicicum TaxID=1072463 RepID=A0A3S9W9W9_9MICO|nr:hypothetical protein [Microbacterium lemovicicum]AZS36890.1 hypothetical protein CVS47_01510 [Microbacterium lemovicicum]